MLPPLARLTEEQAMYHFLSGYTAKVAGTERGITEPSATFSTCFGSPFLPRHPGVYAALLGEKLAKHRARVWLLNTGWTGGPYGIGSRMKLSLTRRLVDAALSGELRNAPTTPDPVFGLAIPDAVDGVPGEVLRPWESWPDRAAYDVQAAKLAGMFVKNFEQYASWRLPRSLRRRAEDLARRRQPAVTAARLLPLVLRVEVEPGRLSCLASRTIWPVW